MIPPLTTATPAWAEAMAAIHQQAFPAEPWSATELAALLRAAGMAGLIDPRGGLALIRLAADTADLVTLAVQPACRRQGIATRLVHASLAMAGQGGAARMVLEVAETNLAARALYAGCGFIPAGRRRGYYADGGDALVLARPCG